MKRILCISISLLLLLGIFAGCAAESPSEDAFSVPKAEAYNDYAVEETAIVTNDSLYSQEMPDAGSVTTNRKLIRKVSLEVETENYDELFANVQQMVSQCGGYIESMDANTRYGSTNRYASLVIRVPADRLDLFTQDISAASNVVYRSESTDDVTLSYVDMESRKTALQVEQERLLALLEQSGSLTEILEIETRLTEVRYELENIESQLRSYDNLVEYATVSLSINEVQVLTEVEEEEKGFWETIGDGFLRSVSSLWDGVKQIFSFLLIASPYLLIFVIVPLVILWIFLRRRKK